MSTSDGSTAANILTAALCHMRERAATYDKPEGERSMGATVDAFQAVTGVSMTEEQGWLFMALLKAVRSQQGAYRADSYEDGAAYFALAGEAAVRDRNGGWTDKAIKAAALPRCGPMCATCHTIHGTQDRCPAIEPASAIDDESERMQAIGQNGNGGEHYGAPDWSKAPDAAALYIDWTGSAAGFESAFYCDGGDRFYRLPLRTGTPVYVLKLENGFPDIDYPYFMRQAK